MEALARNKKVKKQNTGRALSVNPAQPLFFSLQREVQVHILLSWPEKRLDPIQITDPTDPNVGQFYFMNGYSEWGGPDPMP